MTHISKEILLSLRGRQSARAFSERLGYRSNQISRWESGHSRLTWADFCDLCERVGFSIETAFATYEFHDDHRNVERLFYFLMPRRTQTEVAKACKVSPLTLRRWYRNESSPNADIVFSLFVQFGTPLGPLLKELLAKKKMTVRMAAFLKQGDDQISTLLEAPWTIAVACRCLLSDVHGMSLEKALQYVAKQLKMNQRTLANTVFQLMQVKLLGYSDEKQSFYLPEGPTHYEFRDSYTSFINGLKFWNQYSMLVLNKKSSPSLGENHLSYLVFNLQSSDIPKVHGKIIALYKEIAALSQENEKSNQCDRTFSFCMQLNRVEGPTFGELIEEKT